MPYNVNNRSITIFKLSVSFVYLLLLICYSFGVAVTGLDLILFPELLNLIVFPFNELSRSPVLPLGITLLPPKLQRRGLVFFSKYYGACIICTVERKEWCNRLLILKNGLLMYMSHTSKWQFWVQCHVF